MPAVPDFRFATTDDGVRIAYQRFGSGPPTVVMRELLFGHLAFQWEAGLFRRAFEHLGDHLDVMILDRRGVGMSGRSGALTPWDSCLDVEAVLREEGISRTHVLASGDAAPTAAAFASRHPATVSKLVLSNARIFQRSDARAWELVRHPKFSWEENTTTQKRIIADYGTDATALVGVILPSLRDDPTVREFWLRYERVARSRDEFAALFDERPDVDLDPDDVDVAAPTLITHTIGNRVYHLGHGRAWAEALPEATFVDIPGDDHIVEFVDYWREIYDRHISFLTDAVVATPPSRRFAAVMFTDIVESTSTSRREGDEAWRRTLGVHDRTTDAVVHEFGGRTVKSTGDGVLAVFDTPSAAVGAALSLRSALENVGIRIRTGLHAGEIEIRDDDISGSVVNLAARTMAVAPSDEILVTSSLRDQVLGSRFQLEPTSSVTLKGFSTERRLYRLV